MSDKRMAELKRLQARQNWYLKSLSAPRIHACLDLARSEAGIPILPEQLDRDPWLLNCPNGTLELRTGRLRPHRREDYLTQMCPTSFDEDATCPTWQRCLLAMFDGDRERVDFLRRFFGHCLTGDVSEQVLVIFHGDGANGKSTLVNTIMAVLGSDFTMKASGSMVMTHRGERHPTELADLFRKRLVIASEPEQGCRLNEALVKDLTGGERIRARRMREDFWEFGPTHKLILLTNHKPRVSGTDAGIWRRLRLVPFDVRFLKPEESGFDQAPPERRADPQLTGKLAQEAEGILAWMVSGCLDWQKGGLPMPERVRTATTEYRDEEDVVATWLAECCRIDGALTARASELYVNYREWCERSGERPVKQKAFGQNLTRHGFRREKSDGVRYVGLGLR